MSQTENGLHVVRCSIHVMTTRVPLKAIVRCTHFGGKAESFIDGKCGEMYGVLGRVDDIAAVVLGNIFWSERVIMYFTIHAIIFGALVGKCFQQRTASRAWATQND